MSKPIVFAFRIAAAAGLLALSQTASAAAPGAGIAAGRALLSGSALVERVDARSYQHCHNMPRRTRCHRGSRLPVNWPPNTNTPGTSSLRDQAARKVTRCKAGDWFCRR